MNLEKYRNVIAEICYEHTLDNLNQDTPMNSVEIPFPNQYLNEFGKLLNF